MEQIRALQEQSNKLSWELTRKNAIIASSDDFSQLEEERQERQDLEAFAQAHQQERIAAEQRAERAEEQLADSSQRVERLARELESVRVDALWARHAKKFLNARPVMRADVGGDGGRAQGAPGSRGGGGEAQSGGGCREL